MAGVEKRHVLAIFGAGLLASLGYLLAWPVPISPEAWTPGPHDSASWSASRPLEGLRRVALPDGHGPEDVAVDPEGRVHVGLHDGRILRWPAGGEGTPELLARTGGRPLGLHWDPEGRLLVADAWRGLLRLEASGELTVLATRCGGEELIFTDDLDVAADGSVWFSDASTGFRQPDWKLDIVENRARGRLCRWRPGDTEATEVLDGLYFANGVALDPEGAFVLVNETSRYRVRRLWLEGPRAGEDEILVDDLPGFPDGISTGSAGRFWIAVASPRNAVIDATGPHPSLRRLLVRLPSWAQPAPERTARVVAVDAAGGVIHDLFEDEDPGLHVVTSVQEHEGRLYLGSLVDTAWAWLPVPGGAPQSGG